MTDITTIEDHCQEKFTPNDDLANNPKKEVSYPQRPVHGIVFIVTDPIRGRWFGWLLD
jgi:hypothetical protein